MPGELQGILGILMITVPIWIYVLYAKAKSEKLAKLIAAAEAAEARAVRLRSAQATGSKVHRKVHAHRPR